MKPYPRHLIEDPPPHTRAEIKALLSLLNTVPKDSSLLEIGCGTGRLTIPLLRHGFTVTAVDPDPTARSQLAGLVRDLHLPRLTLLPDLPQSQDFFAVVGTDVLHHLSLSSYLPRLRPLLAPGGLLAFSEPGGGNPAWYLYPHVWTHWRQEQGITQCTLWSLPALFRSAGFPRVSLTGLGLFPRPLFNLFPTLLATNDQLGNVPLFRPFAYRYLVLASPK